MLTIRDFNPGDCAYALLENKGRNTPFSITEVTVTFVGRKYVTVNGNQKYENFDSEYLKEVVDYGESRMLFRTKKDAEDYSDKQSLALWLGLISVGRAEKYTVDQLRRVKQILDE